MNLVIVESPTKAKTLAKFLGKDYVIKASMGHIRDLPLSGLGVDVEKNFIPDYVVSDKGKKTLSELKKIAKDSGTIFLASDPDREGESIAWHLQELLQNKKTKTLFKRVVFHELTKDAILQAFSHLKSLDMNLVDAQQARRVLDRLVGYKLSPLLWKKVRYGLSAGRVQSVAVRLIVDKERERSAFEITEYWTLELDFEDIDGNRKFKAEYFTKDEINNQQNAEELKKHLLNLTYKIDKINKFERKKSPYPPLKTSTLQQTMANQHGFSAKKTMISAQKLFEKGIITYHRTDSINLSDEFIKTARSFIQLNFGDSYLPKKPVIYKNNSKNAQEAHEAIRPTDIFKLPNSLKFATTDELKVYTIIWKRSVESQMTSAVYDSTNMQIISSESHLFKANGSVIKFNGFLAVDKILNTESKNSEVTLLPEYILGEKVNIKNLNTIQHFTQPPARYSDATLIKALEDMGIGRPSTYAPTLSTIQARGYVVKDGRYFVPTDVAYVVNDLLTKHFSNIVDYEFTAKLENDLDDVADGKIKWQPLMKQFYEPFESNLLQKEKELHKMDVTTLETTDKVCPECGQNLNVKLGKFGKFLSCSNYPTCKYAEPLPEDKILDENGNEIKDFGKCPNCDIGVFIVRKGRFGKFLACSNYPKCKTIKPFLEKIGVTCPKCKDGDVVIKKFKTREFFGCSNYPECNFSSWQDPREDNFVYDPDKNTSNNKENVKNNDKLKNNKKITKSKKSYSDVKNKKVIKTKSVKVVSKFKPKTAGAGRSTLKTVRTVKTKPKIVSTVKNRPTKTKD